MSKKTTSNFPITGKRLFKLLGWYYAKEVEYRERELVKSDLLKDELSQVAYIMTNSPKWGLYIKGTVGNGKTTMLKAICETVNYLIKNQVFFTGMVHELDRMVVVDAREMVRLYIKDSEKFEDLMSRSWLAIDDLATDQPEVNVYGTYFNPFLELLDYRYDKRKPTVLASNFRLEGNGSGEKGLFDIYQDPRLNDRFKEMFNCITFKEHSYR